MKLRLLVHPAVGIAAGSRESLQQVIRYLDLAITQSKGSRQAVSTPSQQPVPKILKRLGGERRVAARLTIITVAQLLQMLEFCDLI